MHWVNGTMRFTRSSSSLTFHGALLLLWSAACNAAHGPDAGTDGVTASGRGGAVVGGHVEHPGSAGAKGGAGGSQSGTSRAATAAAGASGARMGASTGGATASAGRSAPPECIVPLDQSGCEATYDEAVKAIDCSKSGFMRYSLSACDARRALHISVVDVGMTCSYDAAGNLVAAMTCSKPIGNCGCSVSGDARPRAPSCQTDVVDPCAEDAGTP